MWFIGASLHKRFGEPLRVRGLASLGKGYEQRSILFADFHALLKIMPNIGLWPYMASSPLGRPLAYLKELHGPCSDLILPGHGSLFHDLHGCIDELPIHHAEEYNAMHAALPFYRRTPVDIGGGSSPRTSRSSPGISGGETCRSS